MCPWVNLSFPLSMGVSKPPASSAAPHRSLPPQGAVTANPKSPSPCPLSTSTDRAALSHLSKGSGGALEVPRSLGSFPQIPDLSQSTYLVTLWHCCEHLTALTTSHTIMDLLSTSSPPRAAKIPANPSLSQTPSSLGLSHCQQDTGQCLPHLCARPPFVLLCQRRHW